MTKSFSDLVRVCLEITFFIRGFLASVTDYAVHNFTPVLGTTTI